MLRRFALRVAAVPLALGVGIYLLWLPTRWDGLVTAGMIALYVGAAGVTLGAVALAVDLGQFARRGASARGVLRRAAAPVGLFALTVATGVGTATLALAQVTGYVVVLRNHSAVPVERFEVTGGGIRHEWRDVEPGESRSVQFRFDRDGVLEYSVVAGGRRHQALVEGYVTHNMGGRAAIVYSRDGTFSR